MLTDALQRELSELRHEHSVNEATIHHLENEIDTTEFEIRYLKKWKSGRWIGFVVCFSLFAILFFVEYFFVVVQNNSLVEKLRNKAAAVEFAVSTTAITFWSIILIAFGVFTLCVGIKTILEVGSSKALRVLAAGLGMKNYHNYLSNFLEKENIQKRSLIEIKAKNGDIARRIKELEVDEVPWYEQTGPATLKYY